jgi:hypothetical protein
MTFRVRETNVNNGIFNSSEITRISDLPFGKINMNDRTELPSQFAQPGDVSLMQYDINTEFTAELHRIRTFTRLPYEMRAGPFVFGKIRNLHLDINFVRQSAFFA